MGQAITEGNYEVIEVGLAYKCDVQMITSFGKLAPDRVIQ
jgi:hypothetical protein